MRGRFPSPCVGQCPRRRTGVRAPATGAPRKALVAELLGRSGNAARCRSCRRAPAREYGTALSLVVPCADRTARLERPRTRAPGAGTPIYASAWPHRAHGSGRRSNPYRVPSAAARPKPPAASGFPGRGRGRRGSVKHIRSGLETGPDSPPDHRISTRVLPGTDGFSDLRGRRERALARPAENSSCLTGPRLVPRKRCRARGVLHAAT